MKVVGRRFDDDFPYYSHKLVQLINIDDYFCFSADRLIEFYKDASALVYFIGNSEPNKYTSNPEFEISTHVSLLHSIARDFKSYCNLNSPFVYTSSAGMVYGKSCESRLEDSVLLPDSSYGLTKMICEESLKFYNRTIGLRYSILRISNPIGKWHKNKNQGVVSALIRAAFTDDEFTLYGDGTQTRDYIDAGDVADAIYHVVSYLNTYENIDSKIYNIGSNTSVSLNELIGLIEGIFNKKILIRYKASRDIDPRNVVLDCSQVTRDSQWRPVTQIQKSISDIIHHELKHKGLNVLV